MGRPREGDLHARVLNVTAGACSLAIGIWGARIGGALGFSPLVSFVATAGLVFGSVRFLIALAGRVAGTIYAPSGGRSRRGGGFSYAESLEARGRYREAVEAYEALAAKNPDDATAPLRIARVLRDRLGDPEGALRWFRRAREAAGPGSDADALVTREIVELYVHRLGIPARALPELARLAERFGGTEVGARAREELAGLKREVFGGREGTEPEASPEDRSD